jgi:hypothetical protein
MLGFAGLTSAFSRKLENHGRVLAVSFMMAPFKLRFARHYFVPLAVKVFPRWHEPSEHANIAAWPASIRRNIR